MRMNPVPLSPIEAIAPLLRQVEDLRTSNVKAHVEEILRLQASAWNDGVATACRVFRRYDHSEDVAAEINALKNPYDFVPSGEGSNPAPGNPEA